MYRRHSSWPARRASRRGSFTGCSAPHGFTLLEILIVGALIALFAGLAIFSAQQFYDDGKRHEVKRADVGWVLRVRLPCDQLN